MKRSIAWTRRSIAWTNGSIAWMGCYIAWTDCYIAWIGCYIAWTSCYIAWTTAPSPIPSAAMTYKLFVHLTTGDEAGSGAIDPAGVRNTRDCARLGCLCFGPSSHQASVTITDGWGNEHLAEFVRHP